MPSTIKWRGDAKAVAQVGTVTITGYDVTTLYKIVCGTAVVSTLGTGGSAATTAAALQLLLAAAVDPRFVEFTTATPAGAVITFTAANAGIPFTITSAVSGGAGTIGAYAALTANSSPNDVGDLLNYSGGALPVNGDTLILENSASAMLWRLDALAGVTLASFIRRANYTGQVGLYEVNTVGTPYQEYRPTYLQVSATLADFGRGDGNNGPLFKWDYAAVKATVVVVATGPDSEDGVGNYIIKGTHADNILTVESGSVSVAPFAGETAVVDVMRADAGATVRCGSGVTLGGGAGVAPDILISGGDLFTLSALPTVQIDGGSLTAGGAVNASALIHNGGVVNWNANNITTHTPKPGVQIFYSADRALKARAVTNLVTIQAGMTLSDPIGTVDWVAGILWACRLGEANVDIGIGRSAAIT